MSNHSAYESVLRLYRTVSCLVNLNLLEYYSSFILVIGHRCLPGPSHRLFSSLKLPTQSCIDLHNPLLLRFYSLMRLHRRCFASCCNNGCVVKLVQITASITCFQKALFFLKTLEWLKCGSYVQGQHYLTWLNQQSGDCEVDTIRTGEKST